MNTLSITIVVYKNYNDALEAVNSIETHTDKSLTKVLYIVDNSCDATTDEEKFKFKKKLSKYKDVKYINTGKNLGFGKGHNYVMNRLNSKYHAIVNPDILLKDDSFTNIIKFMESNPSVGMCIPKIVDNVGNIQLVYRTDLTLFDIFIRTFFKKSFKQRQMYHTMQDKDYSKPFHVPFGQGSFLVVKTKLFKQVDGFDERFFMYVEDADFCKRINEISELVYCPYASVEHKWEKSSHKNIKLMLSHISSLIKYFIKWKEL